MDASRGGAGELHSVFARSPFVLSLQIIITGNFPERDGPDPQYFSSHRCRHGVHGLAGADGHASGSDDRFGCGIPAGTRLAIYVVRNRRVDGVVDQWDLLDRMNPFNAEAQRIQR